MISKWNAWNIKYWDICQLLYTHRQFIQHAHCVCSYIVIESAYRQEFYISYAQSHWSFFFLPSIHSFIPPSCGRCFVSCDWIDHVNVCHHGRPRLNACFQYILINGWAQSAPSAILSCDSSTLMVLFVLQFYGMFIDSYICVFCRIEAVSLFLCVLHAHILSTTFDRSIMAWFICCVHIFILFVSLVFRVFQWCVLMWSVAELCQML